jgi:SAM-dependent methyltransferase
VVSTFYEKVILPTIVYNNYRSFLEIGVGTGDLTKKLLHLIKHLNGKLTSIDPSPDISRRLYVSFIISPRARLTREISLQVLPKLVQRRKQFDCIIIDGDHNWYTVYNELSYANELLTERGAIYLHDVSWPYSRRDMYHAPERIPVEFRHPYARKGIIKKQSELSESNGLNSELNNAVYEGGSRNGVLAAIEDFMKQEAGVWDLSIETERFGIGRLVRKSSPHWQRRNEA